ncbi:MAG: zinc-dependent metalloprotease [Acidobacteria bacterium]|nr:zinc-dependent metalloprotease [Acidobacteriota bacterium]MCA1642450.1 zinc-dependent metalloprotease [Acidobacteriota bacterium]
MRRARLLLLLLSLAAISPPALPQEKSQPKTLRDATKDLQKLDGFFPLYWDAERGRLLLEIARFNQEFLYQTSLQTGVGSNPIGLDRGQLGATHVVFFERVGPKVLLVEPNQRYRALSTDVNERRAVEESFARSVLWGFKVEAAEGERVLVDATAFFMRDAHGVVEALRRAQQGGFSLDESRSAIHLPRTKNFPQNTEVEASLTFNSTDPGGLVRQTTPNPQNLTVREHHSLVQLPDDQYRPRRSDPRVGVIDITFYDYATPITEPIEQRWIIRHRLVKKDPNAAVSEPVKPIIYYVDSGAPEPIRSALVEGASWWSEAFEAAGFKNAFQVRVLPEGADPMDIRYNMINWVHRATRGWSIGDNVNDPRTGEIIKGNVTLGSLRIRQDYVLGSGLIPPFADGATRGGSRGETLRGGSCDFGATLDDEYLAALDPATDAAQMALARIRQLAAHEVGHTLGLEHNFAASTYGGRASVMDYPAPLVEIKNGKLDLSNAYGRGIGAYDKFAITYAYAQFPPGADENVQLARVVEDNVARGMLYLTDQDARPFGAANPLANLWDNGDDPVAMLRHEMEVRRIGLSQFGLGNIPAGTPLSLLEAKLLPLYLHHRYQLQAAVKTVGGLYYNYSVKRTAYTAAGGGATLGGASPKLVQQIVPAAKQRAALAAVLDTLRPDALAVPQRILDLIPPPAPGYQGNTIEMFPRRTDPAFDPVNVATVAADLAVSALVEPHRAARLIDYHSRNSANPDFKEVLDALVRRTWYDAAPRDAQQAVVARAVQSLAVTRLMDTAANDTASPQVRAGANAALRTLLDSLKHNAQTAAPDLQHTAATVEDIERFLARPDAPRRRTPPPPTPPGDPIGAQPPPN